VTVSLYGHLTIQVLAACMPTLLSRYCPPVCPPDYSDTVTVSLYGHLTIQVLPTCMPIFAHLTIQILPRLDAQLTIQVLPPAPVCPPFNPGTARLYALLTIQVLPACMPS
jgi:hypothetical protein